MTQYFNWKDYPEIFITASKPESITAEEYNKRRREAVEIKRDRRKPSKKISNLKK